LLSLAATAAGRSLGVGRAPSIAHSRAPRLIALLAGRAASQAAVRGARADYWPRLAAKGEVGGNFARSPSKTDIRQWTRASTPSGCASSGTCSRASNAATGEARGIAPARAEHELAHAKERPCAQVWKAYNDAKGRAREAARGGGALEASDKSWSATIESYQHGLATFPDLRESERGRAQARAFEQRRALRRGRVLRRSP